MIHTCDIMDLYDIKDNYLEKQTKKRPQIGRFAKYLYHVGYAC